MKRRAVALIGLVAAFALSGCASEDWQGRYDDARREVIDVAAERDLALEQGADTMADLEAERARNAQTERDRLEAIENEQAALRRAQELQDALDAAAAAAPATSEPTFAVQDTVARLQSDGLDAFETTDGNVGIRLASDVTFGSGKHALTKAGMTTLRNIGPRLKSGEFANYNVRVEGHTDNEPLKKTKHIYGDNRGLGSARANSVTQFLESEIGIDPSRIEAVSKGEFEPIADNSTKTGRSKNRRVEIILVLPRGKIDAMAK